MAIYAYCRCSTKSQRIDRQEVEIKKYCEKHNIIDDILYFEDHWTGTTSDRPAWKKLLNLVKTGDTILFESVSRMSRSKEDGLEEYFRLYNNGVHLIFTKEQHINTESYKKALENVNIDLSFLETIKDKDIRQYLESQLKNTEIFMKAKVKGDIERAFEDSEQEVKTLQQRTKQGMAVSKAKGNKLGRPPGKAKESAKAKKIKDFIRKHSKEFEGTLNNKQVLAMIVGQGINLSKTSYFKYKSEMLEEAEPTIKTL